MSSATKEILDRAEEILRTAELGLSDMAGKTRQRRLPGLRNVIVFGRSVTWVLQNLKGKQDGFEGWYSEKQNSMRSDPIFSYFTDARNNLEKQGRLSISTSSYISSFSGSDISKFGPPPAGAKAFFIGDQVGGTGWEVELPSGETIKFYVELPGEIGEVTQHFADLSAEKYAPLRGRTVDDLSREYLNSLRSILDEARERFLGEPAPTRHKGHLLPPFIRVVK